MYNNIRGINGETTNNGISYLSLYNEHIISSNRRIRVGCEGTKNMKMSDLSYMNIEYDAVNGSSFAFGCLSCAKLSLGVKYDKGLSKYDIIKPYSELMVTYIDAYGTVQEEWLKVPLGVFVVTEVKSNYMSKDITAYDYAYFYDLGDMTDFPNYNAKGGEANNSFYFNNTIDGNGNHVANTTLGEIINYVNHSSDFAEIRIRANKNNTNNLLIDVDSLGLRDYLGLKYFDLGDNFTLRGFIGYLAGLKGCNAQFNKNGELEFKPVNGGGTCKKYNRSQYGSFTEEDIPMTVNKLASQYIIMKTNISEDGTATYELTPNIVSYTHSNAVNIEEHSFVNPLITTEQQLGSIFSNLKLSGETFINYIPCKLTMIGDPRLELNDVVEFSRRKKNEDGSYTESNIKVPIMKMKMRLNGGCALDIESVADSGRNDTTSLSGSITKTLEKTTSLAKGMFNEIYGVNGQFGNLFANEGKIGQLMAGKVSSTDIFSEQGTILYAKIPNLEADKITGGTLNLSSGITIASDKIGETDESTLTITNNQIIMSSPKEDSDGHTNGIVQRLFIGRRENNDTNLPEYMIEIYDKYGTKLWGSEGLTSEALNNLVDGSVDGSLLGDETISDAAIQSLHATKVLLSKTFEHDLTDESGTHTSLYNYLKKFNGSNVKVTKTETDGNLTEMTLQDYLDELEEQLSSDNGNFNSRVDAVDKKIEDLKTNDIADINNDINGISNDINGIKTNIISIKSDLSIHESSIKSINETLTDHDDRIKRNATNITNYKKELDSLIEGLAERVSNLENSSSDFSTRITNLENSSSDFSTRITNLENSLSGLQSSVSTLQTSILGILSRLTTLESYHQNSGEEQPEEQPEE